MSRVFQCSPGLILNKVHDISDKYKPPIKKVSLFYIPDCSLVLVCYCPVVYLMALIIQITEVWLSSALSHIELFPLPYYTATEDLHTYLIIFPCSFCWCRSVPCQSKSISSFSGSYLKKRFAKSLWFALPGILWFEGKFHVCRKESRISVKINWRKALWDTFSQFVQSCCEASVNKFKEGRDKIVLRLGHWPRPREPRFGFFSSALEDLASFCLPVGMCQNWGVPARGWPFLLLMLRSETQIFFWVETDVQNSQRGLLTTLLEEIHRAGIPLVLRVRAVVFYIKYTTETNKSWAAVQKQAGLAVRSGMRNTASVAESAYSARRYRGAGLALSHNNRLLLFCRLKSCLK